jgi:hypothetical protein
VRLGDDEHELVWSNHHLLLDRWSWPLVLHEISRAYPALAAGVEPALERPARYRDFVAWQQERPMDEAREFWARHFDGFVPPPRLPARAGVVHADTPEERVELTAAETHAVQRLTRGRRIGVNTVIEAAWGLWLARRTRHDDVSFGVTVAGRDAGVPDVERLVGLTLNNLPLRVRVNGAETLAGWLGEVHDAQAEMQQYAHVPLERVQEWSGVPWRTRLFDTLLVFQHDDAETSTRAWLGERIRIEPVHVPTRTAYPLSLIVAGEEALSLRVTCDPRYFDAASARAMAEGLRAALLAMAAARFPRSRRRQCGSTPTCTRTWSRAVRPRRCWRRSGERCSASSGWAPRTTSSRSADTRSWRRRSRRACAPHSRSRCRCGCCSSIPRYARSRRR